MTLPPHLVELQREIRGYAGEFGLDTYEIIFEMVSEEEMAMVASFGGFPTRYPHWKWGMEFDSLSKGHTYGLQKIYELVINTDPCYAYLMEAMPRPSEFRSTSCWYLSLTMGSRPSRSWIPSSAAAPWSPA